MAFQQVARFGALVIATALVTQDALAQKSADVLRFALTTPVSRISIFTEANYETGPFYKGVYDPLIRLDEQKAKFVPNLAKSWRLSDGGDYFELELRDDVTFHDGKKLNSDDVVETVTWAINPTAKIQNQNRYTSWIKSVEALSPSRVRVYTHEVSPINTMRLATALHILNTDLLKSLDDKADHAAKPIGTGPYRVTVFVPGKQVTLERFKEYKTGAPTPTARVTGSTMPDRQTQMAQLLTGTIDVLRDPTRDMVTTLATERPDLRFTAVPSLGSLFFQLDATNRSGKAAPLKDVRVRRAMYMAVDRRALANQFGVAGEKTMTPDSLCLPEVVACKVTVPPPTYDPSAAKKLLAEAGYPDGFDIELVVVAPVRDIATAVSGYLREIGIRATVKIVTAQVHNSIQIKGELQAYIGQYPGQALADAHLFSQLFMENPARDYARDPVLNKLAAEGLGILDEDKRKEIYVQLYNRVNEQAYQLNLMRLDIGYLHSKDVVVRSGLALNAWTPLFHDFQWAN